MNINPFKKKSASTFAEFMNLFGDFDDIEVTPTIAWSYYNTVSAMANAVDMIAGKSSDLPFYVLDKGKVREVEDYPYLQSPNHSQNTFQSFFESLVRNFEVSGNAFILQTGKGNATSLYSINSSEVNCYVDGNMAVYTLNNLPVGQREFIENKINRRIFSRTEEELLYHIKNAPKPSQLLGTVKIKPILSEIKQLKEANTSNLSLLRTGVRLSGVLSLKSTSGADVNAETVKGVQAGLRDKHSGATNSRGVLVLGNCDAKYEDFSATNQDMDFKYLKEEVKETIYNRYKIPLALVNSQNMTMNNLEVAPLQLMNNAVLPSAKNILACLNNFLIQIFGKDAIQIHIDENKISELREKRVAELEKINNLNIATVNEMRSLINLEALPNGDVVMNKTGDTILSKPTTSEEKRQKVFANIDKEALARATEKYNKLKRR